MSWHQPKPRLHGQGNLHFCVLSSLQVFWPSCMHLFVHLFRTYLLNVFSQAHWRARQTCFFTPDSPPSRLMHSLWQYASSILSPVWSLLWLEISALHCLLDALSWMFHRILKRNMFETELVLFWPPSPRRSHHRPSNCNQRSLFFSTSHPSTLRSIPSSSHVNFIF